MKNSSLLTVSSRIRNTGIILIIITGLLNFHPPHFLLESDKHFSNASPALEFILFVNVICAVISAVGIYKNKRWA